MPAIVLPDVGTLSARVELTDDSVAQDAQRIVRSFEDVSSGMEDITHSSYRLNSAYQLISTSTGRFVGLQKVLNSAGIQTTAQVQNQIAALDQLLDRTKGDIVATNQLTQAKERLQRQLQGNEGAITRSVATQRRLNTSVSSSQQGYFQLGYIINDLQQAQYGWSAALRATSNNLSPLLQSLKIAPGVLGALVIAINAAATAYVLLSARTKDQKKETDELKKSTDQLVGSLIRVSDAQVQAQALGLEVARGLTSEFAAQIREAKALAPALDKLVEIEERFGTQAARNAALGSAAAFLRGRGGTVASARQALEQQLTDARSIFKQTDEQVKLEEARLRIMRKIVAAGGSFKDVSEGARDSERERERIAKILAEAHALVLSEIKPLPGIVDDTLNKWTSFASYLKISGVDASHLGDMIERVASSMERIKQAASSGSALRDTPRPQGPPGSGSGLDEIQLAPETLASIQIANAFVDDLGGSIGFAVGQILTFQDGWRSLGDIVDNVGDVFRNVMANVIADIAAAIAKMLILKGLLAIFGGGSGFFSSVIRDVAGAAGISGRGAVALPALTAAPASSVQPRLVAELDLNKLRFILTENQAQRLS